MNRGSLGSEQAVRVLGVLGKDLEDVPVFDDATVVAESEDVDTGILKVIRPDLMAVQIT